MSTSPRMTIEQPTRPPTLAEALELLASLMPHVKTNTGIYGWEYRRAALKKAEKALDAARRFGLMRAK